MESRQVYTVNRSRQLVNPSNELQRFQTILARNKKADCAFTIGEITGQVLTIADEALKQANIFDAEFSDGTLCRFIRDGGRVSVAQAVALGDNPATIPGDLDPIIEEVGGERIDTGNFRIGV